MTMNACPELRSALGTVRRLLDKTAYCPATNLRRLGVDGARHRWSRKAVSSREAAIAAGLISPAKVSS